MSWGCIVQFTVKEDNRSNKAAEPKVALTAHGQTLPAIPVPGSIAISAGGAQPTITAPTANALDVNLLATRTVINWDSFHVSGLDSVIRQDLLDSLVDYLSEGERTVLLSSHDLDEVERLLDEVAVP